MLYQSNTPILERKIYCNPIQCPPFLIYIILVIAALIFHITATNNLPTVDHFGNAIPPQRRSTILTFSFILTIIIDILFGIWIYNLCKDCKQGNAWLVLLLAIFLPLVIAFIVFIIVLFVLGITSFIKR